MKTKLMLLALCAICLSGCAGTDWNAIGNAANGALRNYYYQDPYRQYNNYQPNPIYPQATPIYYGQ